MMAFRYFKRKPALQNKGLLLLQIATRFSIEGKHVAKKTVVPYKGCGSSGLELLYIHAPSIWCTLQCIISWTRREILFLSPNTFSFMIFQESICAKLGGTMKVLEIKWNAFRKPISQSIPKTLYQKIYLCLQLVSRHNLFSIGVKPQLVFKGVIDWGGARFQISWIIKCFTLKMIQVLLCVSKWIFHEFLY